MHTLFETLKLWSAGSTPTHTIMSKLYGWIGPDASAALWQEYTDLCCNIVHMSERTFKHKLNCLCGLTECQLEMTREAIIESTDVGYRDYLECKVNELEFLVIKTQNML